MLFRRSYLHGVVLGLYGLLSLILSWPLPQHITTHVPGIAQWAFDESTFVWNIWQLRHSLVEHLSNPLHTELIWYPLGIDLILYTYNFYHALVAFPLSLAVNLPFASNLALLSSTWLSAYGTFLLVYYLLGRTAAVRHQIILPAFLAGLVYAFASNRTIYAALGHYDMVTTQWIPFYALMLLRSLADQLTGAQRRKAAMLAGLFFAFTGLAEMISALFLAIFTLIVILVYWARRGDGTSRFGWARLPRLVSALFVLGVVAFVIWAPVLLPILYQFLTDDFSLQGWGEAIPLSTDLLGWFTPTILHPLWGGDLIAELRRVQELAQSVDGTGFRDVNTVFLGWVCLALALVGLLIYRRRVAVWTWTSVIFGLFTLGPFLQINGRYRFDLDGVEATFPMPYALLHYLPIIKANRAPNRNSVLLMLGLAVLVGYGSYWLYQRMAGRQQAGRKWLASLVLAVLAGAILFEHLALPLPLSDARVPAVYAQIAADPQPRSVLQIPLGWRNSFGVFGPEQTLLQYYQTTHGKPMLGGNISRAPEFKMAYFKRIPYFAALTEIEFGRPVSDELLAAARAQAADLAYLYDIGYVLLFPPIPERFPYAHTWQASWEFAKATLPLETTPFWAQDGIEAYRVVQALGSDRFTLDLGAAGTYPYRGEGWDSAEQDQIAETSAIWATAPSSRLFVPLRQVDAAAEYQLTARMQPYLYPDAPPQTVALMVNGTAVGTQTLAAGWQEQTWPIPGASLVNGLNRLEFAWAYAISPRQVMPGNRQIGSTDRELPIDVDLKGFADGGFIALFDEAGEQSDGAAGRRGVNVTLLDQSTGEVLERVGFDTTANEFESAAFVDYLQRIEPRALVLVVSHGDATAYLSEAAVEALRGLGADLTVAELRGQYFAIVGVQGAAPGSAAVVVHPEDAFLRISLEPDRRTLAAAVDWVRLTR